MNPLCLTCGGELDLTPEGWAGSDGLLTCSRTGRPHDVQQVIPDPEAS